jgi:hypothetical protein
MRSGWPYPQFIFFEEAKHPILTFEAPAPQATGGRRSAIFAGIGWVGFPPTIGSQGLAAGAPTYGGSGYSGEGQAQPSTIVLDKVDLSAVNLKAGTYTNSFEIATAQLQQKYPNTWQQVSINVYVCDDDTQTGTCSDKQSPYLLSVFTGSLTMAHIPRDLPIQVWANRYSTLEGNPDMCEQQYSPLVLDLKGDGISVSAPENGVAFDLNDTGEKVMTAWPNGADDGLLCLDLDGDGMIDNGSELFGTATLLPNGQRAANGFQALAQYDQNHDGFITNQDAVWDRLRVWIDRNHNGISEPNELYRLDDFHVTSINLNFVSMMEVDPYGNQTRERSLFDERSAGATISRLLVDIWFETLSAQ